MARNKLSFRPTIAHPCDESWAEMQGTHRERHCQLCNKQVHNFAAMTPREIERIVRKNNGHVCARVTQRSDGSLVTLEGPPSMPLGAAMAARIAISASLAFTTVGATAQSSNQQTMSAQDADKKQVLKQNGQGPADGAKSSQPASAAKETHPGPQESFSTVGLVEITGDRWEDYPTLQPTAVPLSTEIDLTRLATTDTSALKSQSISYSFSYFFRHPRSYWKHLIHKQ